MASQLLVCGQCGAQIPRGAKFCESCGAPAPIPRPIPEASPPMTPPKSNSTVCPNCGTPNPQLAKFCEKCGAKLSAGALAPTVALAPPIHQPQRAKTAPAPEPVMQPLAATASIPLFAVPLDKTQDEIMGRAEMSKVWLFGLAGKRTLLGQKPEEYIVLESTQWTDRAYVRVHGVYSVTFVVDRVYPLTVGDDTIEIEVEGSNRIPAEKGALNLRARLRKFNRGEVTYYYDSRGEQVNIQLPPRAQLRPLRTVHPPLTLGSVQELLDTVLDWAEKGVRASMAKAMAEGGVVEKDSVDLSDHEVILVPYGVLSFHNTKTGVRRTMTYDPLVGKLAPGAAPVPPK